MGTPATTPSTLQKVGVALVYALLAGVGAVQVGGIPTTVEGWTALAGTVIVAFWGKFSSSRTVVAMNFK
jgi:hypothetical protein